MEKPNENLKEKHAANEEITYPYTALPFPGINK